MTSPRVLGWRVSSNPPGYLIVGAPNGVAGLDADGKLPSGQEPEGAVLSVAAVQTAAYTSVGNEIIPADATSAGFTVKLPTAPTNGTRVCVKKIDATANAVTVACQGSDVLNKTAGSTSITLTLTNQAVMLQYKATGAIWYITGDDLPLASLRTNLDSVYAPVTRTAVRPVGQGEQMLTPFEYGGKGDGRTVTDAVLNGTTTVTSATAAFTSADVGKLLVVLPAPGSTQAPFATSITARNSATSVTVAASAGYSGTGLEMTVATDDTAALQAWLSDTNTRTRLLPGGIWGFTAALLYGGTYDVQCATGATLKVMAQIATPTTWPAGARAVPTAVYTAHGTLISSQKWVGGVIDTSNLCQDGFAPKWVRDLKVRDLKVRGGAAGGRPFIFGDDSLAGIATSYQIDVDSCLGWRDFGTVPRSAQSIDGYVAGTGVALSAANDTATIAAHGLTNGQMLYLSALTGGAGLLVNTNYYVSAATTNTFKLATSSGAVIDITTDGTATVVPFALSQSTGMHFTQSSSDSWVSGKTVMMGYQVGYEAHGQNIHFGPATHAWSRPSIGLMDYGFDDWTGGNYYTGPFADTPMIAGYRWRSFFPTHSIGATTFNGSTGGVDNVAVGFSVDNPRVGHTFIAPKFLGSDSSHRLAYGFALPNGRGNFTPSHPATGMTYSNVTNTLQDSVAPQQVYLLTGASNALAAAHAGSVVEISNATATTFTLNAGLLTAGQSCEVIQTGAGQITFAAGAGVTIKSTAGLVSKGQNARVRIFRDTGSETFYLAADIASTGIAGAGMESGFWYTPAGTGLSTSAPTNGTMRAMKFRAPVAGTLNALAASVTIVGSAGALLRFGVFADDAGGDKPGTLLLDASTTDGTALGETATSAVSLALTAGQVVWLGVVVQGAPVTTPTIRTITPVADIGDTSATLVLANVLGACQATGITGALSGATFTWSRSASGYRVAVKVA